MARRSDTLLLLFVKAGGNDRHFDVVAHGLIDDSTKDDIGVFVRRLLNQL